MPYNRLSSEETMFGMGDFSHFSLKKEGGDIFRQRQRWTNLPDEF
jgi:hypothetical protein